MKEVTSGANGVGKRGGRIHVPPADQRDISRHSGDGSTLTSPFAAQLKDIQPVPTPEERRFAALLEEVEEVDKNECALLAERQMRENLSGSTVGELKALCSQLEIPGRSKINKNNRSDFEVLVLKASRKDADKRADELFEQRESERNKRVDEMMSNTQSEDTSATPTVPSDAKPETSAAQTDAAQEQQDAERSTGVDDDQSETQTATEDQSENEEQAPAPALSDDQEVLFRPWALSPVISEILRLPLEDIAQNPPTAGARSEVHKAHPRLVVIVEQSGAEAVKRNLRNLLALARKCHVFVAQQAFEIMKDSVNLIANGATPLVPTARRREFGREVGHLISSRQAFGPRHVVEEEIERQARIAQEREVKREANVKQAASTAMDLLSSIPQVADDDLDEVVPEPKPILSGPPPQEGRTYEGEVERCMARGNLLVRIQTDDEGGTRTALVLPCNLDGGRYPIAGESPDAFRSRIESEFPRGTAVSVRILRVQDDGIKNDGRIGGRPGLPGRLEVDAVLPGVVKQANSYGSRVDVDGLGFWGWMPRGNTKLDGRNTTFLSVDDEVMVRILDIRWSKEGRELIRPEPLLRLTKVVKQSNTATQGRHALSARYTPVVLAFIDKNLTELTDEQSEEVEKIRKMTGTIEDESVKDIRLFNLNEYNPTEFLNDLIGDRDLPEDVDIALGNVVREQWQVRREPTEIRLEAVFDVDVTCMSPLCDHPGPRLTPGQHMRMLRPDVPGLLLAVVPEDHDARSEAQTIAQIGTEFRPVCKGGAKQLLFRVKSIAEQKGLNQGQALKDLMRIAGIGASSRPSVHVALDRITDEMAEEMEPELKKARFQRINEERQRAHEHGGARH